MHVVLLEANFKINMESTVQPFEFSSFTLSKLFNVIKIKILLPYKTYAREVGGGRREEQQEKSVVFD